MRKVYAVLGMKRGEIINVICVCKKQNTAYTIKERIESNIERDKEETSFFTYDTIVIDYIDYHTN